jgi:hypothetical protein
LLDYLASRFMAEGWSLKKLHRSIVLSRAYRQASDPREDGARRDPANRLLWRTNRRRLEFEALRDGMLAAAGGLEARCGGRPVDLAAEPRSGRRTVYALVERDNLPAAFRTFDFANPDLHSPQRHATTVPQQALFLLNSPFVAEQARRLAARLDAVAGPDEAAWVRQAHRLAYGREADDDEVALARRFLARAARLGAPGPAVRPPVWQYGWGRWDDKASRLASFQPLPHFTGDAWQGGADLPDAALGYASLSADGGHPGNDLGHAVVRRWRAPQAGVVEVGGTLGHAAEEEDAEADGVRGRIVTPAGTQGPWVAFRGRAKTEVRAVRVKAGDVIDFVVDCRNNSTGDTFTWPVTLTLKAGAGREMTWTSAGDFDGPPAEPGKPLSPREKYAQVLLLSNEFLFVD